MYCANVWGLAADGHIHKLQVVQNRVARIVLKAEWNTSTVYLLNKLNWLSVRQIMFYQTCILVFKATKGLAPEYLQVFSNYDNG